MALAVFTQNLCKTYGGCQVLSDVNLKVPEGEVYGFVGANGAGKTTTIRILLGLAAATKGKASVLGVSRGVLPPSPVEGVAYLPDVPEISPWLGGVDAIVSLARLDGVPADVALTRAKDLLELVGLSNVPGRVGQYSRGMKQRLGIAASLVSAPKLLILDEPTSALDPLGRADTLAVIRELAGQATVIFSSHILADVEDVSTQVGILHKGILLAQGSLSEILESQGRSHTQLRVRIDAEKKDDVLAKIREVDPYARITRIPMGLEKLYEELTLKRAK
ncbi:ABC transporter ATP-binding protein [Actinomycetaceae bacterium TAE3-ERU4]|nr:ABC transporter ATP-binding protein [Actinomycetaceae bacterium TAE3-ERU4]